MPKGMHQISQIEYANCIFSTFEGDSPDTPFFSSRAKDFYYSDKGIKTGKVGRIDMKIANIFFIGNKIFSKMLAKGMHQIPKIEFENCNFFSASSDTPFFSLHWPKIYNSSGKGIKTGKAGGIDVI